MSEETIIENMIYARLIQSAIIPTKQVFDELFTDHFVLFKPKTVASGDFYYLTKKDDLIVAADADCTGHGISGAFMGLLGMIYLNDIINQSSLVRSDEILNRLKEKFSESYYQLEKYANTYDGMDISLIIINQSTKEIHFSGAYMPIYIISDNNLEVYRGDKILLGFHKKQNGYFSDQIIKYKKGDMIYLCSDGFSDQIGGSNRTKFMTKRLIRVLIDIHNFPIYPMDSPNVGKEVYDCCNVLRTLSLTFHTPIGMM